MRFYGIADAWVREVIEFFRSREEAAEALADVLNDEPEWADVVSVVAVDLEGDSPN